MIAEEEITKLWYVIYVNQLEIYIKIYLIKSNYGHLKYNSVMIVWGDVILVVVNEGVQRSSKNISILEEKWWLNLHGTLINSEVH